MHLKKYSYAGFTLPELLIALVINILVIAAIVSVFVGNLNHYNNTLNSNRLNQQLEAILQFITADIRRAGYWANASSSLGTHTNPNPFMASGADLTIGAGNNCILLTYDRDNNGSLPAITAASDDERYGYRLNGTNIQSRPWGANFACNAAASAWENLNDSTISITGLTFTLTTQTYTTGPGTRGLTMRSLDITLAGQLASDSTVSKTLTQHVRVRNDKYIP